MKVEWLPTVKAWRVMAAREELRDIPRSLARYDALRHHYWVPELAWAPLEKVAGAEHARMFQRFHIPIMAAPVTPAPTARPLLPHQAKAVSHLCRTKRAGLFDDMGLGKTAATLAAYQTLKEAEPSLRLLVLCPKRVIPEWSNEAELTLGRPLDSTFEWVTNYDKTWRPNWFFQLQAFVATAPCVLVLDECHAAAGITSKRFVALQSMAASAKYLWALSGTPVRNKPESFFPVYKLISNASVTYQQFVDRFCRVSMGRVTGYQNLHELEAVTRQYCLRREASEVLSLPSLTEQVIKVSLQGPQRVLYREQAAKFRQALKSMSTLEYNRQSNETLATVNRLLMAASHPALVDNEATDDKCAKLELIDELLAESGDQKVLIWSRHPRVLERIASRCKRLGMSAITLHGSNTDAVNTTNKEAFLNDPSIKVCCLSMGAFAEGINLQVATISIYHDLYWAYDKFFQSQRRLWRTGQTKPVHIYYLVGEKTIEEYVLSTLRNKEQYQRDITGGINRMMPTRAELINCLKGVV